MIRKLTVRIMLMIGIVTPMVALVTQNAHAATSAMYSPWCVTELACIGGPLYCVSGTKEGFPVDCYFDGL